MTIALSVILVWLIQSLILSNLGQSLSRSLGRCARAKCHCVMQRGLACLPVVYQSLSSRCPIAATEPSNALGQPNVQYVYTSLQINVSRTHISYRWHVVRTCSAAPLGTLRDSIETIPIDIANLC